MTPAIESKAKMPSIPLVIRKGGSSIAMMLLLPVFASFFTSGCKPAKYADSRAAGYDEYAAPQMNKPLTTAVQAQGVKLVQQYVADMNRKDYNAAEKMLAANMRARWKPSDIAKQMTTGPYWMLAGSRDWKYDLIEGRRNGTQMIVHARFNAKDNNLYKTNFSFRNSGGAWLIDMILNPIQKNKPQQVQLGAPAKVPGGK